MLDEAVGGVRLSGWERDASAGVERASVGGQLVTLLPTKVMVFIDGSWLYHQLYERPRKSCKIARRYGEAWQDRYHVDFARLPQLVCDHLSSELLRTQPYSQRAVEVVRVLVFSSVRADEAEVVSPRQRMFRAMQQVSQ